MFKFEIHQVLLVIHKGTHIKFNAPQKPFGKNLVLLKVVFPEPLLTNRGQRNTKNEKPSPFL